MKIFPFGITGVLLTKTTWCTWVYYVYFDERSTLQLFPFIGDACRFLVIKYQKNLSKIINNAPKHIELFGAKCYNY